MVKELRKLTAKHEARQAKRAEQLGARPAAPHGVKEACKAASGAARRATMPGGGYDGGYDGGYGKSCRSSGAGGGAGGGDKGKPVARGSVHAAAEKGKGGLDRVAERAKGGGGGKGSEALRQGSRSAERRAKSPVPGEQRSPERALSMESPLREGSPLRLRRESSTSPQKLRRESSPQKDRAGGASGGGADGGRVGASRSHPGKSYEREWGQVRGAAKAIGSPPRRPRSAAANPARGPSPAGQRRHTSADAVDFAC